MTPFVEYVEAGFSCIPIRPDGSKAPAIAWKEYEHRRPTLEEARQWADTYEGVALVGGEVSGNLEVIDIDEPTLVRSFIDAIKELDPTLPARLCFVRTPRRNESGQTGCHLLYRCEGPVGGNAKLAMSEPEPEIDAEGNPVINPATGQQNMRSRCLIETRGEGGYVLAVGCSPGCHPTGNLYEHVYGPVLTELSVLTADERETLHRAARLFDRSISETHVDPPQRGYEKAAPGDSPGDAFNERATWPEILEPHGWHCVGESGGVKRWRRPGKSTGYSGSTGILSKAGNELFVCFSTNAHPFEGVSQTGRSGVSYSKFAAYAILNQQGDYNAAAKALLRLGYGTPAQKTERPARVLKTTLADEERRYLTMLQAGETELVSLGIPVLDAALAGGVEKGEMVVIGGLTSHGKTVCGLQAVRQTVELGRHAILVSHEMAGLAIAKRMIATRTDMDTRYWSEYAADLEEKSKQYWKSNGKAFLLECCRDIGDIAREVEQIAAEYDVQLIVIDHAQLTTAKGNSRYEQLTNASGKFKELAIKHNSVCLVLSQLNREAARSGEAAAYHLRETGALEQDADVVVLVKWPWKINQEGDPKLYTFQIEKNRNRPIVHHRVEAIFDAARQTIRSAVETRRTDDTSF